MFLSCHTRIQLGKRQNHNLYTPFPFSFPFSFLLWVFLLLLLAFSRKSGCRGMIFLTLHGRFSKFILNVEDGIHNKREETKKRVFLSLFFAVEFFPVRRRNSGQKKIKEWKTFLPFCIWSSLALLSEKKKTSFSCILYDTPMRSTIYAVMYTDRVSHSLCWHHRVDYRKEKKAILDRYVYMGIFERKRRRTSRWNL